jgi:hypothetical protein
VPAAPPKQPHHWFLRIFIPVQLAFIAWIISGVSSASHAAAGCQYLTAAQCANAAGAATAIGVGLIVALWAAVDVILGIGYGVWKLATRPT